MGVADLKPRAVVCVAPHRRALQPRVRSAWLPRSGEALRPTGPGTAAFGSCCLRILLFRVPPVAEPAFCFSRSSGSCVGRCTGKDAIPKARPAVRQELQQHPGFQAPGWNPQSAKRRFRPLEGHGNHPQKNRMSRFSRCRRQTICLEFAASRVRRLRVRAAIMRSM